MKLMDAVVTQTTRACVIQFVGTSSKEMLKIVQKQAETLTSLSFSSSSTDYSRKDSQTDVIEVEEGCTTNYAFNNNTDDSVQPQEGEPLADEELVSRHNEEKIVEKERLEVLPSRLERTETVDNWYVRLSLRFSSVMNATISQHNPQ